MRIRASTQINDDESRFLTDEQKERVSAAVLSDPEAGQFTVKEMFLNSEGNLVVVFEDVPVS